MAFCGLQSSKQIPRSLFFATKCAFSKVPDKPTWIPIDESQVPETPVIDKDLIDHLERVSLVEFGGKEAIDSLTESIKSANELHVVETDGIEPLDTVLENRPLYLRQDVITEGDCREELMKTAVKTEEEYYVAPAEHKETNWEVKEKKYSTKEDRERLLERYKIMTS